MAREPENFGDVIRAESQVSAETADTMQALMMQLIAVKLLEHLGGEFTLPDGLPIEDVVDAEKRVGMDGMVDSGPLRLFLMDAPESDRDSKTRGYVQRVKRNEKVGRNKLCPCGSGRKHKFCCGR